MLLLDADALNLLAATPELRQALLARAAPTLLSPHPTEAARLLDCDTATVQADPPNRRVDVTTTAPRDRIVAALTEAGFAPA